MYYICLNMLAYYCTSFKHFTALWLSGMATTIMFWPFLKAALFTPIKSCMGQGTPPCCPRTAAPRSAPPLAAQLRAAASPRRALSLPALARQPALRSPVRARL